MRKILILSVVMLMAFGVAALAGNSATGEATAETVSLQATFTMSVTNQYINATLVAVDDLPVTSYDTFKACVGNLTITTNGQYKVRTWIDSPEATVTFSGAYLSGYHGTAIGDGKYEFGSFSSGNNIYRTIYFDMKLDQSVTIGTYTETLHAEIVPAVNF